MAERALSLLTRIGRAYAAALAAIAFFALLAVCYGDLSGMTALAIAVPGVLGAASALLLLDLRQGMAAQGAVDRIAVGLGTVVGALYLVGILIISGVVSRRAENPLMIALICLFPGSLALGSGLRRSLRCAWLVEVLTIAVGGVGWLLILRRAVQVGSIVTLGPFSAPWAWSLPNWVPYMLLESTWGYLLTPFALPFAAFIALRVSRHWGGVAGLVAGEVLLGVVLLGWSYRLAGLVALCGLILHRLVTRTPALRSPWVYALVVVVSILPIDVSLQRGGANHLRFLPGRGGDYTAEALRDPPAHGFVLVGEGLYYSPRLVWVW